MSRFAASSIVAGASGIGLRHDCNSTSQWLVVPALMNGAWKSAVWCRTSWNDERIQWSKKSSPLRTPLTVTTTSSIPSSGVPCMSRSKATQAPRQPVKFNP